MRFGLSFPQQAVGGDPARVRAFAEAADELGFERLTAIDHVVGAAAVAPGDPPWAPAYTVDNCLHEPMTLLAYIAAITRAIGLVTANIILPQRQAVLAAKQAAELDLLSGGRLVLGVGIGWSAVEFDALGMDFASRAPRIEEQIHVMRLLWTERRVTFDGQWHRIQDVGINPGPVQRPIPIWFGADADPAIRRAARLGDGWLMFPYLAPDDAAKRKIETFHEAALAAGRDPSALVIDATLEAGPGGPDSWLRRAEDWKSIGATAVTFRTSFSDFDTFDRHLEAIRALASSMDD